ncbi:MAG: TRC40/GET3/ArsA family transport-energizing ATPase [Deltaproteobacteria bacterium]|nr:TRC40/GET3/ArsA family transport-energizing ATPase [Deltaproteobacteria bacterium]MBW2017349.1 TRC40/GET3/ArsA family transport-energizing ATPase [Deltaproteobacteria bacterium]MBW2128246.1 TRC40/GET3/ArsA family transport-energizing ATPase [Deltaproteobacteria bacterium]MBW2304601.1 TRC40/GET3/ArsA family transport-energizing ATPase [Deltaproteobacteria bacterium]
MKKSMADFFKEHPGMRYVYFGGKGGVGKTVVAAAVALWMSKQGKKTLLASTNPVHSLSNLFQHDVFGRPVLIPGTENLYVQEIDTRDTIEKSKKEIREKISWFLKFADIPTKAEDFIESATMNPAFEESAMFENMINIIFEDAFEFYVFDTAPTANARRLLGMSKVYTLWVDKMMKSREEARSMRLSLSFRKKKTEEEEDPLLDYLTTFRDRIEHMRTLLTDKEKSAFFFVTLLESLPIAVIRRFIGWFDEFGIPIGGVIVNQAIDKSQIEEDTAEFILNRVKMQDRYREEVQRSFENIRGEIPLFEREVRGLDMVAQLSNALFPSS